MPAFACEHDHLSLSTWMKETLSASDLLLSLPNCTIPEQVIDVNWSTDLPFPHTMRVAF